MPIDVNAIVLGAIGALLTAVGAGLLFFVVMDEAYRRFQG